jgi:hypothetical protein
MKTFPVNPFEHRESTDLFISANAYFLAFGIWKGKIA